MLVDGTGAVSSARVRQVPPDGAFEEGLASLARELSVVLATRLVPTHHTLDGGGRRFVRRVRAVGGGHGRGRGGGGGRRVFDHVRCVLGLGHGCDGLRRDGLGRRRRRLLGRGLRGLRHRRRGRRRGRGRSRRHRAVKPRLVARTPFLEAVVR